MGSATSSILPSPASDQNETENMPPVAIPSLPPKPISSPINARAGPGPSTLSLASSSKVSLPYEPVEKEEGEISDDEPSPLPVLPMKRQISPVRRRPSSASPSNARFPPRPSRSPQQPAFPSNNHYRPPRPPISLPQKRPPSPVRIDTAAVVRAKVDDAIPKVVAKKAKVDEPEVSIKVEQSVSSSISRATDLPSVLDVPENVARTARDSPGPISAAPASITPLEARQYMDIIRNLLQNGFPPDDLIRRGATPKYVTAVCQEIVAGQKRRNSVWLETREGRADSEQSSVAVGGGQEEVLSSPSSAGHLVAAPMERKASHGSETSDERVVERMMSPASPKPASKLVASSSWHPGTIAPIPPFRQTRPPPTAVKIESYRPTPPARPPPPTGPSSMSSNTSSGSTANLTVSMKNFHPMSSYSNSRPNTLPPPPHQYRPPAGPSTSFRPSLPPRPPPPTRHEPPVFGQRAFPGAPPIPASLPNPPTSAPPPLPPTTASRNMEAELAARTALLETRRKAFESMKKRREVNRATPLIPMEVEPVSDSGQDTAAMVVEITEAEKSIEEQMADLEKEVMGLQTESTKDDTVMEVEVEEEEEGEIEDTTPPEIEVAPLPLPIVPAIPAVPVRINRGTKRASAEDMMENRPTSLPSRLVPHKRRSLFGGIPQKPQRLLLQLDPDSGSDDSDDDTPTYSSKFHSGASTPIILTATLPLDDTARLLKEKEESIKQLREEIERKMRAKIVAKRDMARPDKGLMEVHIAEVEKEEMVQAAVDVVMAESGKVEEVMEAMEEDQARDDPDVIMGNEQDPVHTSEISPTPLDASSLQPNTPTYFRPYLTLLPRYRLLVKTIIPDSQLDTPSPGSGSEIIDLALLAEIVLTRRLQKEPDAKLCMAEVAGGSCADEGCEDVHIVKGLPDDDDLTEYISYFAPGKSNTLIRTAIIKARESLGRVQAKSKSKGRGKGKGKGKAASVPEVHSGLLDVQELVTNVAKLLDL